MFAGVSQLIDRCLQLVAEKHGMGDGQILTAYYQYVGMMATVVEVVTVSPYRHLHVG